MTDSILIVTEHVCRTLPDSISDRKKVLQALSKILVANHPAYSEVSKHLLLLETLETLQAELPLKFK